MPTTVPRVIITKQSLLVDLESGQGHPQTPRASTPPPHPCGLFRIPVEDREWNEHIKISIFSQRYPPDLQCARRRRITSKPLKIILCYLYMVLDFVFVLQDLDRRFETFNISLICLLIKCALDEYYDPSCPTSVAWAEPLRYRPNEFPKRPMPWVHLLCPELIFNSWALLHWRLWIGCVVYSNWKKWWLQKDSGCTCYLCVVWSRLTRLVA